jgi:hypothetical protein
MLGNIYLHRSVPLLFGVASASASNLAIVISLLVMACSGLAFALVDISENFPFFTFTSVLLLIHCVTALITTGVNFLYIFRYVLVWILIFATACIYAIYQGEVFVSFLGFQYLTIENTRILVLAGILSLCGSLMGWHLSLKQFHRAAPQPFSLTPKYKRKLRLAGYMLAFGFSMLYLWKVGGIVGGDKAYAYVEEGFSLEFGVFNIFHFTGIALILLTGITPRNIERKYVYIAILSLIPGMMAGSRADFLPQAFIVLMLIANPKIVEILAAKRYWMLLLSYFIGSAVLLALAYLVASFIAIWRSGGVDISVVIQMMLNSEKGFLVQELNDEKVLWLETGNMMLGSLYSAIVQVREGLTGLLFGESYLNYLLISPPAFLGLPRPLGLEWFTDINGVTMTLGGIFEVAEAYWNFGLVGCFAVSFGLSYFFAWLLRRGVLHNNYFFLVWYFVFGIHGLRSIWYQTFSYFRLMTVMLVILGLSYLYFRWFSNDHAEPRLKPLAPTASS